MSAVATLCVIVAGAAAVLLAAAGYLWASRLRTGVPGPPTLPILGNLLFFRKLPVVYEHCNKLQTLYGNVYRFYIGPVLIVVVTQAEDAQKLLAGTKLRDRGSYLMRPLRPFLGNGLVTNSGETWKTQRKLIEPCFHSEVLKGFSDAYNEGAQYICDYLKRAGGSQVQLYEPLCLLSMRTLAASVFGLPFEEMVQDQDTRDKVTTAFMEGLRIIQKVLFRPWYHSEFIMWSTGLSHKLASHTSVTNNLVRRAIAYKKMNKVNSSFNSRKALMDTLMESEIQMSDEEIYDEIRTFLMAGTETTACSIGFALVLLSLHPEWQDAAQKELDTVFGTGEDYLRSTTPEELAQLPVIESIIKETLRLYPPVPNASVVLSEDTPLAGGRYVAPRGAYVLVALHLLHRQPDVFPDPEKFDPSRFLENGGPARSPYAYLPFGAGARKCVGARFAMLEIKTVLAAVLRQFRVLPGCTRRQLDQVGISTTGVPLNDFKVTCIPRTDLPASQAK
ncbi:cytochrome P450 4C1-like [Schistocerca nitens]|uniref:cytochrome P450 4C1-like n=1 Tax=Schistocerca nitens TaxID=7011 RepID=UPI00211801E3|nr:cytochrome P450 4C1-like [Schistocerca nitens]